MKRICLVALFSLMALPALAADYPESVVVFTREADDAYAAIRIPAIVQSKAGTLLAFAEGRPLDNDHGQNDIILRRSEDGGTTWGTLQVVAESGNDSLNDPCALALSDSGRVILFYQRYPEGYHGGVMAHTKRADLGYGGPTNTQSFMIASDDDGVTWSKPRDVTRQLRRPDVVAVGSPGNFIQIAGGPHAGRLVLPLYETVPINEMEQPHRLTAAYSDDLAETWKLGERMSYERIEGWGTEAQIAEMDNGTLLMSARDETGNLGRIFSTSDDGGATWSAAKFDTQLMTPPCMSSLVSVAGAEGKRVLFHTLPQTDRARENGQLFRSSDGGATWAFDQLIYPEGFAYSALVVLKDGRLGCLYERDEYKSISYAILDVK